MVTVVGLGFVGLTTALGFAEYGHKVYGIEADPVRMAAIREGKVPFLEPGLDDALTRHLGKNFIPAEEWEDAVADSDFVFYCVGTPSGGNGEADLSFLYRALEQTVNAVHDHRFRVLVIKSTIPPSTTQKRVIPFLAEQGVKIPERFGVANNPEFLREGHSWEDFINADRIVLGVADRRSEAMLRELYKPSGAPTFAVSLNTGEFIKYLSNTSLACLISFSNEMSIAADTIGDVDTAEAFRILHLDKRWQSGTIRSYFYPGCGYGGYCLPKDTSAFHAVMEQAGFDCRILKDVIETNDRMPMITAERIIRAAGADRDICIGILGLSFNAGSADVRDTPAAKVVRELNRRGYHNIIGYDPVAVEEFKKHYGDLHMGFESSCDAIVHKADILAILTAWAEFGTVREKTDKAVVDCRYML